MKEPPRTAPTLESFMQEFEKCYASIKNNFRSIAPDDKFADLGLDSLAALELLVNLEHRFGVNLVGEPAIADAVTVRDVHSLIVNRVTH